MRIPQKQCQTSEKRNAKCFFAHLIYISPQAETKIFFACLKYFSTHQTPHSASLKTMLRMAKKQVGIL